MNGNMWEVITVCDHLNDRWERENKVRRISPQDILQFYGVKNFKASGGSYFCASVTQRHLFDLNSAGRTWNDNIIWLKGMKSTVERKESLLDEVAEEETKLELVLGELGLSRKKSVESRSKKVTKAQSTRSMAYVDEGTKQTSRDEIKKALAASGITVSGEVAQGKRRRVEPLGGSGERVTEGRPILVDDLKVVEERARLAIHQGKEDTSQMVAHLVKGIWLGIEEQESELKKVEAKANVDEMVEERDRLGRYLILKGYFQEEVDIIKVDTYAEEEEEEVEVLGVVDGLDGVSPQTVPDNHGDDVVREMSLRINDLESGLARERETSKALLSADQAIARAKKAEARERSGGSRTVKENANLRECQHKLDAALIREKVLEEEIKAKKLLLKGKEELLKDLPVREELNAELVVLHALVTELLAMNLAESAKYIDKLKEDAIYHDRVDANIIA
ncbi:hypothetical protein GIB67_019368 [Kingdonia uniflora]|uniref:Uncharacterized protein n=1 Tax=Kingdonia uniflora TaxID=39325 RepID=A0A7J7M1S5_9MAGN|nr:hypothetical protein GIB67_019368 [Kingdonia uniflora]